MKQREETGEKAALQGIRDMERERGMNNMSRRKTADSSVSQKKCVCLSVSVSVCLRER